MSVTGTAVTAPTTETTPATYTEQLALAKARLSELLATPAKSYQTASGESGITVYYRDMKELQDTIAWLEKQISKESGKGRARLVVFR